MVVRSARERQAVGRRPVGLAVGCPTVGGDSADANGRLNLRTTLGLRGDPCRSFSLLAAHWPTPQRFPCSLRASHRKRGTAKGSQVSGSRFVQPLQRSMVTSWSRAFVRALSTPELGKCLRAVSGERGQNKFQRNHKVAVVLC